MGRTHNNTVTQTIGGVVEVRTSDNRIFELYRLSDGMYLGAHGSEAEAARVANALNSAGLITPRSKGY